MRSASEKQEDESEEKRRNLFFRSQREPQPAAQSRFRIRDRIMIDALTYETATTSWVSPGKGGKGGYYEYEYHEAEVDGDHYNGDDNFFEYGDDDYYYPGSKSKG